MHKFRNSNKIHFQTYKDFLKYLEHPEQIVGDKFLKIITAEDLNNLNTNIDDCFLKMKIDKKNIKNYEDELLSKRPTVGIGAAAIRKSFFIEKRVERRSLLPVRN